MTPLKPLQTLLLAQGIAAFLLAAWWVLLPVQTRQTRLCQLADIEQAQTLPPPALLAQVDWLVDHRAARLQGLTGLLGLAVLFGSAEGMLRRHTHPYGGFLLTAWTLGRLGLALLPGALLSVLLLPWPLTNTVLASGLASLTGGLSYALACGRPHVS